MTAPVDDGLEARAILAQSGGAAQVAAFARRIYPLTRHLVGRCLPAANAADHEDVTHVALLHGLRQLEKYRDHRGEGAFRAWWARLVTRVVINESDRLARWRRRALRGGTTPYEAPRAERSVLARELLDVLTPQVRDILNGRLVLGLTFPELAQRTGLAEAAVKARYYRAVRTLQRLGGAGGEWTR